MRRSVLCPVLFLLASACFALPDPGTMRVAVLEFDAKGEVGIKEPGAIAAEWMSSALTATGKYQVLERSLLDKILQEQSLSVSGMIDERTSARIGQLSGAQAVVSGSLVKWNDTLTFTARLIDLSNGSVLATATYRTADARKLSERMGDIARVLAGQLPKEALERDSLPAGKPGTAAVSVVRATPKGGVIRLILDRGELDGMVKGQCLAVMMPVYDASEISGERVRTGMRRVGALAVSYVEPNYSAGDFLPELGLASRPEELVAEALALPILQAALGTEVGALNLGGYYGMSLAMSAGVFGMTFGYEAKLPAAFLYDGGMSFGLFYEYPLFGNYLSRSRSGPGVELIGRMSPSGQVGADDSILLFGGAVAAYWQLKARFFQARLGARASYSIGEASIFEAPIADAAVSVASVEPFITIGFAAGGADFR
jgi:hypothetical protein